MIQLERLLFSLLIFSLFIQLGKHFWPPFSYISGIRVDYLSPTLYVSDVLILLLLLFSLIRFLGRRKRIQTFFAPFKNPLFGLSIVVLVLSTFFAKSPFAAFFALLKLAEFSFVGAYVAYNFKRSYFPMFVQELSVGAFVSAFLAAGQVVFQSSLGGPFYFLGERTFNTDTLGIATIHFQDKLLLRPYATFPHPNVLAFYLLFVIGIVSTFVSERKFSWATGFYWGVLFLSAIALFLTFSRIAILCFLLYALLFGIMAANKSIRKVLLFLTLFFMGVLLYLFFFSQRFFDVSLLTRDWILRQDLLDISQDLFFKHPFFGIGLNNFFTYEILFQKVITPTLLQPVHNIYMLVLSEVGILGFVPVAYFLIRSGLCAFQNIQRAKNSSSKRMYVGFFFLFFSALLIGVFDHFLLTTQQGQLMTALILGLCWAKIK